ncbi:hypothetical protein RSSM_03296 [Rhodopirellula sallentina SM41]|uniref:Uncharacterized protein n=1 Tax=Rhodopirellula sallentina SM41 TaxID=1263870 RepID=M5U1D9_9BACT|nr:hypothetical protein RSSM_03296 [Rhodopirellula sallentina SM41]
MKARSRGGKSTTPFHSFFGEPFSHGQKVRSFEVDRCEFEVSKSFERSEHIEATC